MKLSELADLFREAARHYFPWTPLSNRLAWFKGYDNLEVLRKALAAARNEKRAKN